jgi:hypothetical protein
VREVNLEMEALEEIAPEDADLLALRDGIRGDERDARGCNA